MKKLKSVLLKATIFGLIATLVFSGLNISLFARAATSDELFNGNVTKRVVVGDDITLPDPLNGAIITIKSPAGSEVEVTPVDADSDGTWDSLDTSSTAIDVALKGGKISVLAGQIGNYTITYTKGDGEYSFNVLSYESKEYFVNVIETKDAFIPSFANAGSTLTLPTAELSYTNRKGDTVKEKDLAITDIKVVGADAPVLEDGKIVIKNLQAGLLTISYETKLNSATTKLYRKVFNVNVQTDFENDNDPTISVNSFTTSANVNVAYTLPKATARDVYDENPYIDISVIGPDLQPVRVYEADKNGYAIVPVDANGDEDLTNATPVEFNNNNQRTFYPTMVGKYKVTYIAYNGAGNSSAPYTNEITVKDNLAPVITEIEDTLIPQTWAINSVEKLNVNTDSASALANTNFKLPFPVVADNLSKEDDLKLVIRITNPAGTTVAEWNAKVSEYKATGGKSLSSAYDKYFDNVSDKSIYNFKSTGMDFSFNYFDFGTTDSGSNDSEDNNNLRGDINRLGDWTVTYSLYDELDLGASGNARKTYTINVANSLTDIEAPVVNDTEVDLPEFVLLGDSDTAFKVPSIGVTDNYSTARINVDYIISSDATVTANETVEIEGIKYDVVNEYQLPASATVGGQSWQYIEDDAGVWYMLASNGNYEFLIKLDNTISLSYKVVDHVGNVARPEADNVAFYDYTEGNYHWDIDVMYASTMTEIINVTPNILLAPVVYEEGTPYTTTAPTELRAGDRINLGGFEATGISVGMLEHTGYELSILDEDGKSVPATVWSYFSRANDGTRTLTISDIVFTPTYASTYRLNVRFYNIAGDSVAFSYAYEVLAAIDGSVDVSNTSATIGSTGSINTSYRLEKSYTTTGIPQDAGVIVRKITGRSFSIIGNTILAHTPSTYTIRDYIYNVNDIQSDAFFFHNEEITNAVTEQKVYVTSFANNESPVIEVQDDMPIYVTERNTIANPDVYVPEQFVTLPVISAYTAHENAEVKVSVTFGGKELARKLYIDANGDTVFTVKDNTFAGIYAFAAVDSGDYTVTVTATASGKTTTEVFTIKVGKRTLPVFTVENLQLVATVGDVFRMGKPVLTTETGDEFTVKIILRDPNTNTVHDVSYSQNTVNSANWSADYAETSKTFEKSGNYELVYEVTNKAGLKSTKTYIVTVSASGTRAGGDYTTLTVVLIILAVLLIASTVVYVVRFKAVKK